MQPKFQKLPNNETGFHKCKRKLQRRIIKQQRYLQVIQNCAIGLFPNYKLSVVADEDVAWLPKHNHIVNPLAVDSVANRQP